MLTRAELSDYLKTGGLSRLIGLLFGIGVIIVAGQLLSHTGQFFAAGPILAPVVRDPFTVLAYAISSLSYVDLDFMKFRLSRSRVPAAAWDKLDTLLGQDEVANVYAKSFGSDVFVRAWNLRFLFLLSFAIACFRWILTWR
jgi:hypothetical protein